jgi:transposase InsO family protein
VREEVIDYVRYWSEKAALPVGSLIGWLGIGRGKFYGWRRRYGEPNDHNAPVPRWFWLEPREREAIVAFRARYPLEGYRRLAHMMVDADVAYASPSTVYRVLKERGLLGRPGGAPSRKGDGFHHPAGAHHHWHMDISYVNICGTFYYLCGVLDGYSRYVVHWEIRERMRERDVETILQRAAEKFPDARPRIITDNGPQFIARDFKAFIRICGMTHVRTSPFYPQSNGKYERFNRSLKAECIRPQTPLCLEDARRIVGRFVAHYNDVRLHSAIGYVAPRDKLEGRAESILARRRQKLAAARAARKARCSSRDLTERKEQPIVSAAGETEASPAGKQLARDSRPGTRRDVAAGAAQPSCPCVPQHSLVEALMPEENPGSPQASHPLTPDFHLSISR